MYKRIKDLREDHEFNAKGISRETAYSSNNIFGL